MYTAAYELLIPLTIVEAERRSACALHAAPTRPARRSPARWLRARWAAIAGPPMP